MTSKVQMQVLDGELSATATGSGSDQPATTPPNYAKAMAAQGGLGSGQAGAGSALDQHANSHVGSAEDEYISESSIGLFSS